jgi:hypothetical protein
LLTILMSSGISRWLPGWNTKNRVNSAITNMIARTIWRTMKAHIHDAERVLYNFVHIVMLVVWYFGLYISVYRWSGSYLLFSCFMVRVSSEPTVNETILWKSSCTEQIAIFMYEWQIRILWYDVCLFHLIIIFCHLQTWHAYIRRLQTPYT